jgi:acyl-CoA thioesterase
MSISQQDRLACKFMGTFGTLDKFKGMTKIIEECPKLPPVEECLNASEIMKKLGTLNIAHEFDMLVEKDGAFATTTLRGKAGDKAELTAWIRFTGGREPCLRSLTFFGDALPPPVLNVSGPSDWVPTIEYTTHLWNRPNPKDKWLRARFVSNYIENGKLYTDGEIWSEDGRQLYAKSRQLARLLSRKG